jgi:multidrug efflux pump subunit AcrB
MVPPTNTPTNMPTNTPTDSFINLTHAMLLAIALVYLLIVIQVRLLLVTGRALDLSALIVLRMQRGIVGTNAIMLRDFAVVTTAIVLREIAQHEIEAGADVRTALIQGGRTRVCPVAMPSTARARARS